MTGASSGIGRAVALELARAGGRLVVGGRDEPRLEQTLSLLPGAGHVASACVLKDADQTADWIRTLSGKHGVFAGVFHSVGVELVRPVRLIRNEHLEEMFGSGLFAAFGVARAVAQKDVVTDGGSVVFMSSVAAMRGQLGMAAYSANKAAIDALVRSLACELAARGIRANSIAAGAVTSEMHQRHTASLDPQTVSDYKQKHLLGFGAPQDISAAALFLLSDASRWITGTAMVVDGGYAVR